MNSDSSSSNKSKDHDDEEETKGNEEEEESKGNESDDSNNDTQLPKLPYRRDRTPSIVVQSLGLTYHKETNRRLSLNIVPTGGRRQSLTVDGLASFANPGSKDSPINGNATGSLRNKVALKPGHSLMGWTKLASTAKDLAGTNGKTIEVTPEELAKHDQENDCWVALKGNVYNITTYLQYHPGGVEELMKGAGREATELFNEVHKWVNYESLLAKCLIGPYKLE